MCSGRQGDDDDDEDEEEEDDACAEPPLSHAEHSTFASNAASSGKTSGSCSKNVLHGMPDRYMKNLFPCSTTLVNKDLPPCLAAVKERLRALMILS